MLLYKNTNTTTTTGLEFCLTANFSGIILGLVEIPQKETFDN